MDEQREAIRRLEVMTKLSALATKYGTETVLGVAKEWCNYIDRQKVIVKEYHMGKEYGNAIEVEGDSAGPLDAFMLAKVQGMLDFNYEKTHQAHPEYNLPERYEFIVGPVRPAYETEECRHCGGKGTYLVNDGDDYYDEMECGDCDNGRVIIRVKDGRWVHTFAWYAQAPPGNERWLKEAKAKGWGW